jgi:putative oxygen-independent coproporphyrinogen III oxidase
LTPTPLGVYVHWPYCARICPYCDFNVVRDRGRAEERATLVQAMLRDLHAHAELIGARRLGSIFFGGGTPSLMDPDDAAAIVEAARALWPPADDIEITLEANPTDAEAGRFAAFAAAGVDRLSLGLQSLNDDALRGLGRNHDAASARRAAERAVRAFARVSVDMIYALPDQTPSDWAAELRACIALGAEHISPYQLTIEPGTPFHRAVGRGTLRPPPEDRAADLYEVTQSTLGEAGYEAYEVSNHARGAAARSRHNLIYWRGQDYLGVGPGAHGRFTVMGERWASLAAKPVGDYVRQVEGGLTPANRERLTDREVSIERLLMGLRTVEGVDLAELAPLAIDPARVAQFEELAELVDGRVLITAKGRPVLDRIIRDLAHGA